MGEYEEIVARLERIEAHAAAASTVVQENQGYLNGGRPGPVTETRLGVYNSYANLAGSMNQLHVELGTLADAVAKLAAPTVPPVDLEAVRQIVREELAGIRFRRTST